MSYYEGLSSLSLSNEKNITVVFDFGYAYTKIGFAGEVSPRAIVKSEVKSRATGVLVPVFEFTSEKDLIEHLVDFIHPLYFKKLLVNSKDRRVVIVENILGSTLRKNSLATVFFKYYEVVSICFVPSHLVSLMTLAVNTGLVIDIGYEETTVIPVYEGVPILNAWQAVPCGSKSIHKSLCELLLDRGLCTDSKGKEDRISAVKDSLPEDVLEDIKVRCCVVSTLERSKRLQMNKNDRSVEPPPPPPSVEYPFWGDFVLTVPGTVREMASEVIFELDQDNLSLGTVVLHSIMKCPVDTRRALASNLVIIGGSASLKGLKSRLLNEIRHFATRPPFSNQSKLDSFKVHKPPAKDNYVAWLGGAILGCTEGILMRSLSRESYFDSGCVPDWSDQSFNLKDVAPPSGRTVA